jgi:hypothetical protein
MALIVGRYARRARLLLAFAFAGALAAEPTLIKAQQNPAVPAAPAATRARPRARLQATSRRCRRAYSAATN